MEFIGVDSRAEERRDGGKIGVRSWGGVGEGVGGGFRGVGVWGEELECC